MFLIKHIIQNSNGQSRFDGNGSICWAPRTLWSTLHLCVHCTSTVFVLVIFNLQWFWNVQIYINNFIRNFKNYFLFPPSPPPTVEGLATALLYEYIEITAMPVDSMFRDHYESRVIIFTDVIKILGSYSGRFLLVGGARNNINVINQNISAEF